MRIHLGFDHAAFPEMNELARYLTRRGFEVVNHGPATNDPADDYPEFCINAAMVVAVEPGSLGLVAGGSGNGEQIAANKVNGVRAALAWNVETAKLARQHNDANVLSIGARMHSLDELKAIVDAFLDTEFSAEERHERRIGQIRYFEGHGTILKSGTQVGRDGALVV